MMPHLVHQHMRNQMTWGEVRRVQSGPGYELRMMTLRPGTMLPVTEDATSHRMVTVTTGSGLLKTGAVTRPLRIGDNFEIPAGESASIYCGPESEMQLVEVVCEVTMETTLDPVATLQLVHS